MKQIGRNEPCPCGSGKKFKRCHLGREGELIVHKMEHIPDNAGKRIIDLPEVHYGRSKEFLEALDIEELTGARTGIKMIDLQTYQSLGFSGRQAPKDPRNAGLMVNPKKTEQEDPNHIYLAITPDINDSTLIHQIAHVLDYLAGSRLAPGGGDALSMQTGIPPEQLDHTKEFAGWLMFLKDRFHVELDAEDEIISFLNEHHQLFTTDEIKSQDTTGLLLRSERLLRFLRTHKEELDLRIRTLQGYMKDASHTAS